MTENSTKLITVNVLSKLSHIVNGIGYECTEILTKISTYTNFVFANTLETKSTYQKLTAEACKEMIYTKKCGNNFLNCVGSNCEFVPELTPKYRWLSSFVHSEIACYTREISVIAENLNDKLFGLNCVAKDYKCETKKSIIIWDKDIVHECPFDWVFRDSQSQLIDDMIINKKRRWLLKIDKRSNECKDYFKNKFDNKFENGLPIFRTTEGLYVSFKNESINLRLNLNLGETV